MFRFTAGRAAATPWFSRKPIQIVLARRGDGSSGVLQPGWRTATPAAPAPGQALQSEDGFFKLLTLQFQFREHFVDVQMKPPYIVSYKCVTGRALRESVYAFLIADDLSEV